MKKLPEASKVLLIALHEIPDVCSCLVFPFLLWPSLLTCGGRARVTATAVSLMRQYRNRFYSNADHTRRIKKGRDVTKSDYVPKKRTGRMPCAYSFTLMVISVC